MESGLVSVFDLSQVDEQDNNAIMTAARVGDVAAVRACIDAKMDLNVQNRDGMSAVCPHYY